MSSMGTYADLRDVGKARELRASDRIQHRVEVNFESDHNFYVGFTENISDGGIFVATDAPAPLGTVLTFELLLESDGTHIRCKGIVRWIREASEYTSDATPGMGVQFVGLTYPILKRLNAFLQERSSIFFDDD